MFSSLLNINAEKATTKVMCSALSMSAGVITVNNNAFGAGIDKTVLLLCCYFDGFRFGFTCCDFLLAIDDIVFLKKRIDLQ